MTSFQDSVGRTAWLDDDGMVYTQSGKNPTGYDQSGWNKRQLEKYGDSSSKSSSKDPVASFIEAMNEATKKQVEAEKSYLADYAKNNPFAFDEQLAKQSATAEYTPYYTELLNDYLSNVDLKRQTIQDDRAFQTKMKEYDLASRSRDYTQAVSKAEEGFAGSGMFFSGIKNRALGGMEIENTAGTNRLLDTYANQETGRQRQESALNIDESMKRRDIGREQEASIESGVLQRKNEALKAYETPFIQNYFRRFPSSSGSALQGYITPSGFCYSS